jgi:hypothetical protein
MTPTETRGTAPSHSPPDVLYAPGLGLARGLGWFGIAFGVAAVCAPRLVGRLTGISDPILMRACGAREIGTGIAILQSPRPTGWMWGRVAGDAWDAATLLIAAGETQEDRKRAAIATAAVCGIAAVDAVCATQLTTAANLEG